MDGRYDACALGDAENDGRVDFFVNGTLTDGIQYREHPFRNTPEGLVDVTTEELLSLDADHGAQWADFRQDGALDPSLAGVTDMGLHLLLRNQVLLVPLTEEGGGCFADETNGNIWVLFCGESTTMGEPGRSRCRAGKSHWVHSTAADSGENTTRVGSTWESGFRNRT